MDLEIALQSLAGIIALVILLALFVIKISAVVFILFIVWSLLECIIEFFKKKRRKR